ncbi:hypothetical protein [Sulfodiicoccus acidiphilus]|uniref:hypothetical protein n=1 Tax=Sulfodiicoccus acidiphilus TaxID=1670455 RepID=UPI000F844359|nr:hypothetical protein [Sulfodiicoccus acidiphilus]
MEYLNGANMRALSRVEGRPPPCTASSRGSRSTSPAEMRGLLKALRARALDEFPTYVNRNPGGGTCGRGPS